MDNIIDYAAANWNTGGNYAGAIYLDGAGMPIPTNPLTVDQQQTERVTFNSTFQPVTPAQFYIKCATPYPATEVITFSDQQYSGGTAAQYNESFIDEPGAIAGVAALTMAGFNSPSYSGNDIDGWLVLCSTDCLDDGTHGPSGYTLGLPSAPGIVTISITGQTLNGNNGDTATAAQQAAIAVNWSGWTVSGTVVDNLDGTLTLTYTTDPGAAQYAGSYTSDNFTLATITLTNGTAGATQAFSNADFGISYPSTSTAENARDSFLTTLRANENFTVYPDGTDSILFVPAIDPTETTDFGSVTSLAGFLTLDDSRTVAGASTMGALATDQRTTWEANHTVNYTIIGEAGDEMQCSMDVQNANADTSDFGGTVLQPYIAANASILAWLANGNSLSYNT